MHFKSIDYDYEQEHDLTADFRFMGSDYYIPDIFILICL